MVKSKISRRSEGSANWQNVTVHYDIRAVELVVLHYAIGFMLFGSEHHATTPMIKLYAYNKKL